MRFPLEGDQSAKFVFKRIDLVAYFYGVCNVNCSYHSRKQKEKNEKERENVQPRNSGTKKLAKTSLLLLLANILKGRHFRLFLIVDPLVHIPQTT